MANKFEDKYKEWKIEGKREKTLDANYMGSESLSRLRYQSSQSRGRSRDKQGDLGMMKEAGQGAMEHKIMEEAL